MKSIQMRHKHVDILFLTSVICYAQKCYPNEKISLDIEVELSGSYGNRPVDYVMFIHFF
jgi:hypothetical protein